MRTYAFLQKPSAASVSITVLQTRTRSGVIPDNLVPGGQILDGIAIADGLFTGGAEPRLIGGRDRETGRIVFPCPAGDRHEPVELPRKGRIWSWTIQRFRPKTPPYAGPEEFEPFALAYVELPDAVIVEAPLTGIAFDAITIGMEVETVLVPLNIDASGRTLVTYAFTTSETNHG